MMRTEQAGITSRTKAAKRHLIDRKRFLQQLSSVKPGLYRKGVGQQSLCFVFRDGKVMTFNGDATYSCPCDLKIEGAVSARHLLAIVKSFPDDQIKIAVSEDRITFFGGSEYAGHINIESETHVSFDAVEKPRTWKPLPAKFDEAVRVTVKFAARDNNNEKMMFVHMTPKFLEACDNHQAVRYGCVTGLPSSRMVKATTLKWVVSRKVTEFSTTQNWLHFRNDDGVVISGRSYRGEYEQLDRLFIKCSGPGLILPKSLIGSIGRVGVFADSDKAIAELKLSHDKLVVRVAGPAGMYEEDVTVEYGGHPRQCRTSLKGLLEMTRLANRHPGGDNRVRFSDVDIMVDGDAIPTEVALLDRGEFMYVTCPYPLLGETT